MSASNRAGKGGIVPPVEHRWRPGQSGNPRGRPRAGMSFLEWVNEMHLLTEGELRALAKDESQPQLKRAAALHLLRTGEPGFFNATPLAANDIDRILDRDVGRPTQRVEVERVERDPAEAVADLARLLREFPQLAEEVRDALPPQIVATVMPTPATEH